MTANHRLLGAALLSVALLSGAGLRAQAGQAFRLTAGENFFGLAVRIDKPRLWALFHEVPLPESTRFQVYGVSAEPEAVYRLDRGGSWLDERGGLADDFLLEAGRGYAIVLPDGSDERVVTWSGPDNREEITLGVPGADGKTQYAVLAWPRAWPVRVRDLGLKEAGLAGGNNAGEADEIRVLEQGGAASSRAPKARIWINPEGAYVLSPSGGDAGDLFLAPGEAFIVVRKRGPGITWTVPNAPP